MVPKFTKKFFCKFFLISRFAPGVKERHFVAETDHLSITLHYAGYPDPKITWKHRGWDIDTSGPTSNIRSFFIFYKNF